MNEPNETFNFKSGQEITAKAKNLPFVTHKGIIFVLGNELYIMHNTIENNVDMIEYDRFLEKRELVSIKDTKLTELSDTDVLNRYNKLQDRKFNLVTYNCEHFIAEMKHEPIESKSVELVSRAAVFFLGGIIFSSLTRI